jgi:2-polyprenyl-3-methyl-5-hydroxy-6-metoxy-1,4-benzoquinol methylase
VLNLEIGRQVALGGVSAIQVDKDVSGYALIGPYESLEAGEYTVEFRIMGASKDIGADDFICALIDVVADRGAADIAFDYVLLSETSRGEAIRLDFSLDNPRSGMEYRVRTNGTAALIVEDKPKLTRRTGPKIANRWPSDFSSFPPSSRRMLKQLWERGVQVNMSREEVTVPRSQFENFAVELLKLEEDRRKLAEKVVDVVGYRGVDENSLFRAFVGTERPIVSPPERVPFTSTLCHQAHFGYEQYRFWAKALKETPKYQRKQWEFVYIAQSLFERGYLTSGNRGLVFGAGQEQLPALFASFGVRVLATDQSPEDAVRGGWIDSNQHTYDLSALNQRSICTDRMFSELVSYKSVDMNAIPKELDGAFDFCWSACALEHLGSLEKGLSFIENSLHTLKPGGLAVHTTEYNLSSNETTVETENLSLYRRQDIDRFVARMNERGFEVAPIDWELGEGFAETVVDLNPYWGRGEPHIRLKAAEFDTTSLGLIIRKPQG